MCGSSQQAVHFAAQAVAAGDARYAIGCGVENMTRVRMFSDIDPDGRHGGFGGLNPELFPQHELIHQGESAERIAEELAALARRRSTSSRSRAIVVPGRRSRAAGTARSCRRRAWTRPGGKIELTRDEGVRERIDPAKMATLKTVFRESGVITAANSSQISDGASAVLVADRDRCAGGRPEAARALPRAGSGRLRSRRCSSTA